MQSEQHVCLFESTHAPFHTEPLHAQTGSKEVVVSHWGKWKITEKTYPHLSHVGTFSFHFSFGPTVAAEIKIRGALRNLN